MKRILTAIFVTGLAGFVFLLPTVGFAQGSAKQANGPAAETVQGEEEVGYTVEEYEDYEKSTQEPDLDKRLEMLDAFIVKYPESKLMIYITNAYEQLIREYSNSEQWDKLITVAEQMLKTFPDNELAITGIAAAAQKLGDNQKFLDYALKIYEKTPDPALAYGISQAYNNLKNQDKYLEWTEKLFAYPEFNGEFNLRMLFVNKYFGEEKYDKAADYAQKALDSLKEAKKPATVSDADWNKQVRQVRKSCYFVRGINYFENTNNYQGAIKEFQNAVNVEKYTDPYYYMGHCYWKLDQIEDAIDAFAKAYVLGGNLAPKAEEYVETLYKPLHNNSLVGIDKVYRRAKQELGI